MVANGDGFRSRRSSFHQWSAAVAIYRLLQNSAFAPEDIAPLVAAYEDCLRALKLSDRSDRSLRSCKEDHRNRTDWNYGSRAGSVDWRFRKSEFPAADECGP